MYDVQSVSGAATFSFTYRYADNFSVALGAAYFFGHREFIDTSINGIGPGGNRPNTGPNTYKDSIEPGLSLIRDRDELWMRLRYTF